MKPTTTSSARSCEAYVRRWRFQGNLGQVFKLEPVKPVRNWRRQKHYRQVNLTCANCGCVGPLETDHVGPLHRGGKDEWSNLQSLCVPCHAAKTAREAGERAG